MLLDVKALSIGDAVRKKDRQFGHGTVIMFVETFILVRFDRPMGGAVIESLLITDLEHLSEPLPLPATES